MIYFISRCHLCTFMHIVRFCFVGSYSYCLGLKAQLTFISGINATVVTLIVGYI